MKTPLISDARRVFHQTLVDNFVLTITPDGIASNADPGNAPSVAIAMRVAQTLGARVAGKIKGQTAGKLFEEAIMQFIAATFPKLQHLRPGSWRVVNLGNQSSYQNVRFCSI